MQPETRYARLGEDKIAYQILGEGPDLLYVTELDSHVDVRWEQPLVAAFLRRLASFSRLIVFDRRGTGASDPLPPEATTWESWLDDVRTVMDAAVSDRATILSQTDGGPMAMLFAATDPERVEGLVLFNSAAKMTSGDDYPWGIPAAEAAKIVDLVTDMWGTEDMVQFSYPSMAEDTSFRQWFAKYTRAACSPRVYKEHARWDIDMDVRHVLPSIRVPTLVMHRRDTNLMPVDHGRYIAEHIPGATFLLVPGGDSGIDVEAADEILGHIEEFITGTHGNRHEADRVLATLLFTDIVGSTDRASEIGDRRWRTLIESHDAISRGIVDQMRGRFVKSTGDGMLATFDGPGRAIRCALTLNDALKPLGLQIRAGLHSGEIELRSDGDIGGISVHITSRVMEHAVAGEVVVSRTVKDLVAGSGFEFEDRSVHQLKGVPEEWQLFAVKG